MDGAGDRAELRELHPSNIAIIREVYDSESSYETFEIELERALEANCMIIIIEPARLGDETARWISVGNCLHKTAVISGLTSILSALIWPRSGSVWVPLSTISFMCTGLYTVAWQWDPCVHYQVERDTRRLARLPVLTVLTAASPVVLVRKDESKRRYLHCTVTIAAVTLCAWKLYNIWK